MPGQIRQAAAKASLNFVPMNIMPSFSDALTHATYSHLRIREPKVEKLHKIAAAPCLTQQADVGPTAQGGFQAERVAAGDAIVDFAKQKTRCFDCARGWI